MEPRPPRAGSEPDGAGPVSSGGGTAAGSRRKWLGPGAGSHYGGTRWKTSRAALRDPMLVDRILDHYGVRPALKPVLDAPCGTGRLRGVLERRRMRWVGVDVSASMLREARGTGGEATSEPCLVMSLVDKLPFRDDSFDVVVCCRLLHHLHDPEEIEAVVRELTRVSHRMVIASFWDSASLHAWRRLVGLRRSEGPAGRRAVSKRSLRRIFDAAGAEVVGYHHSFRFVSQQAFVVALKRAPVDERAREHATLRSRLLDLDLEGVPGSLGQA
jgi:ribonuclease P protein component